MNIDSNFMNFDSMAVGDGTSAYVPKDDEKVRSLIETMSGSDDKFMLGL